MKKAVILAAIGAAFALLGGITLAYFEGWLAPKTLSSRLEKPTVETQVKLQDFLEETKIPITDYTPEQLGQVGYKVHFQVQLVGYKGRTCKARWEVFSARTNSRIFLPGWDRVQEPVEMIPDAETDSAAPNFWLPPFRADGPFFVRIAIYDDNGVELTSVNTDQIRPF